MKANPENEKAAMPPLIAWKTLKNFWASIAPAIPTRIDKSIMPTLSNATKGQLLQALRVLGCIDSNGLCTPRLRALAKLEGEEYQIALQEALADAYPFLKDGSVDLSTTTMQHLQEQFATVASGDTVRKILTFFIPAAKEAGYALSPYIREPGKRAGSNGRVKRQPRPIFTKPSDSPAPPAAQEAAAVHLTPKDWHQMLLDKFPAFDPSWPGNVQEIWFQSFEKLMEKGEAKREK